MVGIKYENYTERYNIMYTMGKTCTFMIILLQKGKVPLQYLIWQNAMVWLQKFFFLTKIL